MGIDPQVQLRTLQQPTTHHHGATSRNGEDPFTFINQASNDEEADGKPDEDEGAIVKGTGGFSPMPKTTAFRSRKLTSTSSQKTIVSMRQVLRPRHVKPTIHFSTKPKGARAKDAKRNRWERMMGQCDYLSRRTYYH